MDANESKVQTPNLVEKLAKLEKQNAALTRRVDRLEKAFRLLETYVNAQRPTAGRP